MTAAFRPGRRGGVAALVAAAALVLTGCSSDPNSVANQAKAGDQKGYLSGDGRVEHIPVADRGAPVELAGRTVTGKPWSRVKDAQGKVVVVNKWGSWCGPCVAEAGDLEKVWMSVSTAGKPVAFVGIDTREAPENGAAFLKAHAITYPSLSDETGVLELSLQGKAASTPSTLVLDSQGRIAGRIAGIADPVILTGLIDDVLADEPGGGTGTSTSGGPTGGATTSGTSTSGATTGGSS